MGETPVLQYLSGVDDDVIPSEIAKKLKFSRARMSHILESLESKGYIQRRTDQNDRRRVLVSITEEGRDFAAKKNAESVASLSKQLSALGEHDAQELVRILNKAYSLTYDADDYLDNL
ncbi:MarR family transcriptional regulator [Collinsella sp. CLA-AA-H302]|uniref:MarR family winged helix-turn-helix transcriptional regulator n=1 Tax=Collinsella sp. CLA-AA-H302 TaxID=3136217 RepID=UPI0032C0D678